MYSQNMPIYAYTLIYQFLSRLAVTLIDLASGEGHQATAPGYKLASRTVSSVCIFQTSTVKSLTADT